MVPARPGHAATSHDSQSPTRVAVSTRRRPSGRRSDEPSLANSLGRAPSTSAMTSPVVTKPATPPNSSVTTASWACSSRSRASRRSTPRLSGTSTTGRIRRVRSSGAWSRASNTVTATLLKDTTPAATPVISSTGIGPTHVDLTWSYADNDPSPRFDIFVNGQLWHGQVAGRAKRIVFLSPATNYTFTMRARDSAGNWSAMSDPFVVSTPPADPNAIAWAYLGGWTSNKMEEKFITITPMYATTLSLVIVHELSHFCGGNQSSGKDIVHRASPDPFPTGTKREDGSTNYRDMPPFHARTNVYSYTVYCYPDRPEFKVPPGV